MAEDWLEAELEASALFGKSRRTKQLEEEVIDLRYQLTRMKEENRLIKKTFDIEIELDDLLTQYATQQQRMFAGLPNPIDLPVQVHKIKAAMEVKNAIEMKYDREDILNALRAYSEALRPYRSK